MLQFACPISLLGRSSVRVPRCSRAAHRGVRPHFTIGCVCQSHKEGVIDKLQFFSEKDEVLDCSAEWGEYPHVLLVQRVDEVQEVLRIKNPVLS